MTALVLDFAATNTLTVSVAASLVGLLGLFALMLAALIVYFYRRKAKVLQRRAALDDQFLKSAVKIDDDMPSAGAGGSERVELDTIAPLVAAPLIVPAEEQSDNVPFIAAQVTLVCVCCSQLLTSSYFFIFSARSFVGCFFSPESGAS